MTGWSRQRRDDRVAPAHCVAPWRSRSRDESGAAAIVVRRRSASAIGDLRISGSRHHRSTATTSAFGQLYRDRGDGENIFDEMKNQWGWGGFTTHDLARCRLAAQLNALFYDWWNIFVRLAEPDWHREAITSRPLSAVGRGDARAARAADDDPRGELPRRSRSPPPRRSPRSPASCASWRENAEQLARPQKWRAILWRAFQAFLNGRLITSAAQARAMLTQPEHANPKPAARPANANCGF